MPSTSFAARSTERVDVAQAVIAPPPPPLITIGWDKGEPTAETEVWQTQDWKTWELFAVVPGDRLTVQATNAQAFYKIRNRFYTPWEVGGYIYSEWAKSQQ